MNSKYTDDVNRSSNNYFNSMDLHFAGFIADGEPVRKDLIFLAAALVSRSVRYGHICLDLNSVAGSTIIAGEEGEGVILCPAPEAWLKALQSAACVGNPGEFKPLILDENNHLYLQRYWQYEQNIAADILSRITAGRESGPGNMDFSDKFRLYFSDDTPREINWQKVAAAAALLKKFLVISGSPGTGKTTTITKIMALILDVEKRNLRIAMAAPTGKAAARLQESVQKTKAKLNCAAAIKELIPNEAQTIHRLLGSISKSPYFRFNEKNPLPYDLVVIDEASMVDLPLLAKLLLALPQEARIIMLGDKDQLASVDAGVVLGDICSGSSGNIYSEGFARQIASLSGEKISSAAIPAGIQDSVVQLQTNYRFTEQSGIHALSRAVNNGNAREALELLQTGNHGDIAWTDLDLHGNPLKKLAAAIIDGYSPYLRAISVSADQEKVFDLFEKFRILCALRVGDWGTQRINAYVERILSGAGLISPRGLFYHGMPVMIIQNDYRLHLFNGDVGIILRDDEDNQELRAFFRNEQGKIRKITPVRLPQMETVWAMTVHKSQGSEYDRVLLILSDRDAPVLTRELIYTGITRTRQKVEIWAGKDVLAKAISRRISRQSGLSYALRNSERPNIA